MGDKNVSGHDVTHVKSAGQWYPLKSISTEDLTITLGLNSTSGSLSYTVSDDLTGQTFTATFYDAQDQVLSAQTTNLTTDSSVTIPVGATKVELYDTHPTSTHRRITSGNVVSVLKWAKREPTLNSHQLYNCPNLLTVPNEAPVTTNMSSMFENCPTFNSDLSGWDVSKVTNMARMFYGCSAFNQSLSGWDVSKLTSMASMFFGCSAFNSDLSGWNVSNVTNMGSMFRNCSAFNSDLSGWCVSKIITLPPNFVTNAPLMTSEKLPVWGTCPVQ